MLSLKIEVGMTGTVDSLVERADTAADVGSGSLLVYATPCMAALMEGAACEAIESGLDEGETTVGIALDLQHTAATPVGMDVTATAEVTAVDGKIITFSITASDEAGTIGTAIHKRAVVNAQRFLDKTYAKL